MEMSDLCFALVSIGVHSFLFEDSAVATFLVNQKLYFLKLANFASNLR